MICPNGHGYDDPGMLFQCPICGADSDENTKEVQRFYVGRRDLKIILGGLDTVRRLMGEKRVACTVQEAQSMMDARNRLEVVRARARYGKRRSKDVDIPALMPEATRVPGKPGKIGNQTQEQERTQR